MRTADLSQSNAVFKGDTRLYCLAQRARGIARAMLDLMRRQSTLIYLIFGGIIFIFAVNFGPGSSSCMKMQSQMPANWAAKVDGEPIRQQDFVMVYQRQMEYMRRLAQRSGAEFDTAMAERMGLRRQVMDQLVERRLLAKEAEQRGLVISDEELITYMREQYGVKDVSYETYESWVTHTFDTSVSRFEDDTRSDIAAQRMARLLNDSLTVGETELKDDFKREHDRAMVTYTRFDAEPTAAPAPAAAAVDKLLADDMPTITAQYNKDSAIYRTPAEVHVRQIVKKLTATATDAEEAEARNALVALKEQLSKGADFAALATQNSQDEGTAKKGGDMGMLRHGQIAPALDNAAFALQNGQVSDPVRSPIGLHLLQVVERKEPARRELEEVKREVAVSILRKRTADAMAKSQADSVLAALKAGKQWKDITEDEDSVHGSLAKVTKPLRRETPWILRTAEAIPRIGLAPELRDAIFKLTPQAPLAGQVHKVQDSYYVVSLKDRELPDLSKFDESKDSLREQAVDVKRNRVLRDWLAYLRNQAKVQMNPAMLAPVQGAQAPEDNG